MHQQHKQGNDKTEPMHYSLNKCIFVAQYLHTTLPQTNDKCICICRIHNLTKTVYSTGGSSTYNFEPN